MKRNISLLVSLLAMTLIPLHGGAQGTFPRNGDEALALRIHRSYRESQARLAQLEANRIKVKGFISEVAPASTMVGTAIAPEDVAQLNEIVRNIAQEQKWCLQLEAFWDKNRAIPPAPPRSFAGRYGPLNTGDQRSTDPKYDKIEYAIRTFPFSDTPEPARGRSSAVPPVTPRNIQGDWVMTNSSDGGNCNGTTISIRQTADGSITSIEAWVTCERGVATGQWTGSNFRWVNADTLAWSYRYTARSVDRLHDGTTQLTFTSATVAKESTRDAAGNEHWGEYRKQ